MQVDMHNDSRAKALTLLTKNGWDVISEDKDNDIEVVIKWPGIEFWHGHIKRPLTETLPTYLRAVIDWCEREAQEIEHEECRLICNIVWRAAVGALEDYEYYVKGQQQKTCT